MTETETGAHMAQPLTDHEFKANMSSVIPQLRAFARGLCRNLDQADDLVQEAMLKMWTARGRFEAGTHFRAWAFTILRNHYYSEVRRNRFVGVWDDLLADRLASPAGQDIATQFNDVVRALQQLPAPQREALMLVAGGGLSYEEAAVITGVAIGTIKSRVGRARVALEAIIDSGILMLSRSDVATVADPVISFLAHVEEIKARATGANASARMAA
ncbi:sigma-70 family RNA polymerase sigma factor [Sphingomonas sp. LaA6.9]|uniref:sigma-70 family RNA polymerase sigma factor n=1 Tax=Sphingomonas sp. LaA6.9 TaxID=2919914 RepID=UPI001F4F6010|nr:sigma-70 family RNA polymerase sigma factor [Sphingomonas sp. LaA6.9]MCJ8159720.1 sigma-70 family RNA polymerase sigma factor [Sphingomonas sp. LaA6.9]